MQVFEPRAADRRNEFIWLNGWFLASMNPERLTVLHFKKLSRIPGAGYRRCSFKNDYSACSPKQSFWVVILVVRAKNAATPPCTLETRAGHESAFMAVLRNKRAGFARV